MSDTEADQKKMQSVVEKVRKLLALAAKAGTEAEAAAATEKAQALLEAYNIDMLTIEQGGGDSGKREEQRLNGGMYIYERELWTAIAELNFCFYFTTRQKATHKRRKISFAHRIVGRVVNVAATKAMAIYLQGTIERLCRERFPLSSQFFSREAVAFREGMSDKLSSRLWKRRQDNLSAAEAKAKEEEERRANAPGLDTRFALTLIDVKKSEEAANYDFLHGEGAFARREQRYEKWNKDAAERRAAEAKAEAEAEAEYAAWAAANPEEAAKEAAKERKREERENAKAAKREERRSDRWRAPTARERRQNSDYYDDGYRKGNDISLDQQIGDRSEQKRIGKS